MANKKYEETDIQAIAEAIREKTGSEDSYKVSDMVSGVNEVYEAGIVEGKKISYETITITQDCTNAKQIFDIFRASYKEDEEFVIFINEAWYNDTLNMSQNIFLFTMCGVNAKCLGWLRWRDGGMNSNIYVDAAYDMVLSIGDKVRKVVLK